MATMTPKIAAFNAKLAADKKRLFSLDRQYKAAKTKKGKDAVWAKIAAIIFQEPE